MCVRFGNCRRGAPRGDYVVFPIRLQSVSLTRDCIPSRAGFTCGGEFSDVFNFGPGVRACPPSSPPPEQTGASSCALGLYSWSNAGVELPGGFAGADFGAPARVVGNLTPGKTITCRYPLTLAFAPGHDPRVRSLANIWLSLDGAAVGPASNFAARAGGWWAGTGCADAAAGRRSPTGAEPARRGLRAGTRYHRTQTVYGVSPTAFSACSLVR